MYIKHQKKNLCQHVMCTCIDYNWGGAGSGVAWVPIPSPVSPAGLPKHLSHQHGPVTLIGAGWGVVMN